MKRDTTGPTMMELKYMDVIWTAPNLKWSSSQYKMIDDTP